MSEYAYKNIPLTPSVAAELISEFLSQQTLPQKRGDIIKSVEQKHRTQGGALSGDITASIKKALNRLTDEGVVRRPAVGWYAPGIEARSGDSVLAETPSELQEVPDEMIVPEISAGAGGELVYVYFSEAERKLAKHEGRDWWPCKVGFTAGNLTSRILGQGPVTSMARLPVVGLVIRTEDGHSLERTLHLALIDANASIDEGLGAEWFDTSPQRIMDWYSHYLQANERLRR